MPVGWKCSSVLTPPTRLALASKPSAGRVKALCSFWYMPIRLMATAIAEANSAW